MIDAILDDLRLPVSAGIIPIRLRPLPVLADERTVPVLAAGKLGSTLHRRGTQ